MVMALLMAHVTVLVMWILVVDAERQAHPAVIMPVVQQQRLTNAAYVVVMV